MPPRHLQHPDADDILSSINRHLLTLQHHFRAMAAQTPQPLAVEDAPELWEAWADEIERVRADLQRLLPARATRRDPSSGPGRLPGKPFGGTLPGQPRPPGDER